MHASQQDFRAPWSKLLIGLTIFSVTILVGVGLLMFGLAQVAGDSMRTIGVLVMAIVPASTLFVVQGYSVRGQQLFVQRLLWRTPIDLVGLREIHYDPSAMDKGIKTLGNGGCFSFTGWFYNRKLGHYRAFATSHKNSVVLKFDHRTIVVTPDHPEEFVATIQASIPVAA